MVIRASEHGIRLHYKCASIALQFFVSDQVKLENKKMDLEFQEVIELTKAVSSIKVLNFWTRVMKE